MKSKKLSEQIIKTFKSNGFTLSEPDVLLESNSVFDGNLIADKVTLGGLVKGEVAANTLNVSSSARVEGNLKTNYQRGNIIFWKGHVAICINSKQLIHAYGPEKKVLIMPILKTIKRIENTAKLKVKKIAKIKI